MKRTPRSNRFLATLAVGLVIVAAACGGSDSKSDGERDRNISAGVVAQQSAHPAPYQVAIYRMPDNKEYLPKSWWQYGSQWGFVCNGVILNSRWIATTSNCITTYGKPWDRARFHIGVGKVNPWAPVEWDNQPIFTYGVESAILGGTWDNFALLKTDKPLDFVGLDSVRPIDLPFGLDDSWPAKGQMGQISGYGISEASGSSANTLRTALVEVLADAGVDNCGDWGNFESATRICLGKANVTGGGLACRYDWGGPLVINVDNRPVLAGLVSEVDRMGDCENGGATLAVRMRTMVKWIAGGTINDFTATPDDGSVTLSWSAPRATWFTYDEDENWDPGTKDYVVEMSEDGGTTWSTIDDGVNTNTEVTIGGLENGKGYAFRIAALNEITADRADYRYYSSVAKATAGKLEQPVVVPDMEEPNPAANPQAAPTLPGQAPQGAADLMPVPADVAVAAPNAAPASTQVGATSLPPGQPYVPPAADTGTKVSAASTGLSTFNPIGSADVAKLAKADVPAGSRVSVAVDKSSKKVCTVKGATLVALSTGKCKVKVSIAGGKGKPKSKSTTLTVSK